MSDEERGIPHAEPTLEIRSIRPAGDFIEFKDEKMKDSVLYTLTEAMGYARGLMGVTAGLQPLAESNEAKAIIAEVEDTAVRVLSQLRKLYNRNAREFSSAR